VHLPILAGKITVFSPAIFFGVWYFWQCWKALISLWQMEPGLVRLIADLAVDFSGGQDGGSRAR